MPDTIELNFGDKWTIPLKQYENRSPMVNIKRIITIEDGVPRDLNIEMTEMMSFVNKHLEIARKEILSKGKADALKEIRFYEKDGKNYPSVTSIISPEPYDGDPAYGIRGDILHRIFSKWITSGRHIWDVTPEEQKATESIGGIPRDKWDLNWIVDLGYDFRDSEVQVFNDEHLYAGTYDSRGFDKELPAMFDLKSGNTAPKNKDKAYMQMSAYIKASELDLKEMIILSAKEKKAFSSTDIDGYFAKFLQKRAEFKDRYGI